MKFNGKVVAAIVGASSVSYVAGIIDDVVSNACDADIVLQASQEDFLKHVLVNCIDEDETNHINYSGEPTLSPSICLNQWIEENQSGSPIPESGDCRTAYQNFIDYAAEHWRPCINPVFGTGKCTYNSSTGLLTINDSCVETVINDQTDLAHARLDTFLKEAGHHLAGQQCSAVTLRKWAIANAYPLLVQHAAASTDYTTTLVGSVLNDGGDGLCYECYHTFARAVEAGMTTDTAIQGHSLAADCTADPNSDACIQSTVIQNALADFKVCSGGFEMQFIGPVCSQTEIDAVQALIPVPYYTLTFCAYNPSYKFCESIQSYLNGIERFSDSSCVLCYQDFFNTMTENAAITANVAKCTGDDGVWDSNCIALAGPALQGFHACSGYTLSIAEPTVAPPVVITTTEAPVVTDAPDTTTEAPVVEEATTTAAPDTTTVEPTTTKSVSAISASAAALLFVVAAFVL